MTSNERLERWLDTATEGLSAESKRRVRHEITEHHRSAREDGLDDAAALDGLGDPRAARRAFRRAYLTSVQESLVRDYRGLPATWRLVIYVSLFVLGCGVALGLPETTAQRHVGRAMLVVLASALASLCFGVPWLYRKGRERIAIFLGAVSDWTLYVGLIVGSSLVLGDLNAGKLAFFLAVLALLLVLYVPLLRKLHRDRPGTSVVEGSGPRERRVSDPPVD
jgi:hypothetical protein